MKLMLPFLFLLSTLCAQAHPLVEAADKGYLATVQRLVESGVDVDSRDDEGETALHQACDQGHLEIVKYLLAHRADPNAYDDEGETPFHEAIEEGRAPVFEALLAAPRLDLNAPKRNLTPLMLCVDANKADWVEMLLRRGVSVGDIDGEGRTALDRCKSSEIQSILQKRGAR